MNEYLASPVTSIVISVLAIAISLAVIITIRSRKRKFRKEQERRRMEIRVAQQLDDERRSAEHRRIRAAVEKGKPLRKVRLQDVITQNPRMNRYDPAPRDVIPSAINRPKKPANIKAPAPQRSATSRQGDSRRYDPSTDSMMMGTFIAADAQPDWSGNDSGSRHSGNSGGHDNGSSRSDSHGDSSGGGSSSGSDSGSSGGDSGGGGGGCD